MDKPHTVYAVWRTDYTQPYIAIGIVGLVSAFAYRRVTATYHLKSRLNSLRRQSPVQDTDTTP
jgi:hypothetical protein